jgi:hypothetical protein
MEATHTHWKKLRNPLYLGAYDFEPKEERNLVISKIEKLPVMGADGKSEDCTVVNFLDSKPIILNSTNAKAISKATGSNYIEDWVGKTVTLFTQKIRAFGESVDALRIKANTPKVLQPINAEHFAKGLQAIKAGTYTAEKLKAAYQLTPEQIKQL